jgi:hypothetical protein
MNMINGYPTEEELRNRIMRQLEWRGPTDAVALMWCGYLSALLEWGVIEIDAFKSLSNLLPRIGRKELHELFSDEPITPEQEQEIDDLVSQSNRRVGT